MILRFSLFALMAFAATNSARAEDGAKKRVVGIVIFQGVEALDFCGPYEVFSMAHRHGTPPTGGMEYLYDVRIIAATAEPITARGGLKIVPNNTFKDCPQLDILVVPGVAGAARDAAVKDKALLEWVTRQSAKAKLTTSVCTGAFILAEAGLLDGKRAATHQMSLKLLLETYPKVTVVGDKRVIEDGNIVTAAGVSSGIDMALKVVERLDGEGVARMVSRIIEYPPPIENK